MTTAPLSFEAMLDADEGDEVQVALARGADAARAPSRVRAAPPAGGQARRGPGRPVLGSPESGRSADFRSGEKRVVRADNPQRRFGRAATPPSLSWAEAERAGWSFRLGVGSTRGRPVLVAERGESRVFAGSEDELLAVIASQTKAKGAGPPGSPNEGRSD